MRVANLVLLVSVAVLALACTGTIDGPPSSVDAGETPSATVTSTSATTPTPVPIGDVAPVELIGLPWIGALGGGRHVVGEVGSPDRLILDAGAFPIAVVDGHVLLATPTDGRTSIERVDLHGGASTWTVVADGNLFIGSADRNALVMTGSTNDESGDPGLVTIALAGGEMRTLVAAGPPPGDDAWTRTALLTDSGTLVLSSLCGVEKRCQNQLFDGSTGAFLRDLPGTTPVLVASDLVGVTFDGTTAVAIGLSRGKVLWKRDDRFGGGLLIDTHTMVSAWTDRAGATFSIEVVDLTTGDARIVLERPADEDWTIWRELSTAEIVTIGHGGRLTDVVLAGDPIVGATVNVQSGVVEKDAVRIAPGED